MITIDLQETIKNKRIKFPGGEVGISTTFYTESKVRILARLRSNDDVMSLLLLTEALRSLNPTIVIHLFMPYVMYGRQDRRMKYGDAMSLKVFASLINQQQYASVTVLDPHSDVSVALLDRCIVHSAQSYVEWSVDTFGADVLIAPDAGASKRVHAFGDYVNRPVMQCYKSRDPAQRGLITSVTLDPNGPLITGKRVLIVDDICDGGATFITLAQALRQLEPSVIGLYVTHGIFSKGIDVLTDFLIEQIYTVRSYFERYDHSSVRSCELFI